MISRPPGQRRLSRRELALVAVGLAAWVAMAAGGLWFYRQMTRAKASCGIAVEARSLKEAGHDDGAPRNALQLLAGSGRCPP